MCRIPWVTGQCFEHVASLLGMRQEGTGTELSEGGAEGLACARWGSCRRGLPVKSLVHLEHTWSLHSPPFCVHIILRIITNEVSTTKKSREGIAFTWGLMLNSERGHGDQSCRVVFDRSSSLFLTLWTPLIRRVIWNPSVTWLLKALEMLSYLASQMMVF